MLFLILNFPYYKRIPVITPDLPFLKEEKSYSYHGSQIKLGLEELGKAIGQEPDYEKLKKAIDIENKVTNTQLEIFELKKATPCPVENMFNAMAAAAAILDPDVAPNIPHARIVAIAKPPLILPIQ